MRLLLATEHTEFDTGAEQMAYALARRQGSALPVLLPILSNPEFEAVAPEMAIKADAEAAKRRRALEAEAGLPLVLKVRRGPELYLEIVEEAREQGTELLVIRRRGKRGWLANLLVGEMVSKVVAHASCPMLIVPRGAKLWSRRVLVGVDPGAAGYGVIDLAIRLAKESQLPLTVVCVVEAGGERTLAEAAMANALSRAQAAGLAATGLVREGRVHQALLDAIEEQGADLLVLGRHSGGLARAWVGGSAQKLIGLVECPVLVDAG